MPYVGKEPVRGQNRELDDISGSFNGGNTAFTMQVGGVNTAAGSANQVFISLGGVMQNPGTDFTVVSSTITFTTPPANGLGFWGLIQGDAVDIQEPADGSVTAAKLASGAGIAVLTGSTNNTITTVTGAGAIQGEANLTFDGNQLSVTTNNSSDPLVVNSTYANKKLTITETSDANSNGGIVIQKKHSTLQPANYWYGDIAFHGWDGSQYLRGGLIECRAEGTPASNNMPGYMAFSTNGGAASHTERLRITSGGDVEVKTGDLIFGTAGKGICLGVTSNTDANTLADYEEGTWVPNPIFGSTDAGETIDANGGNAGTYTKIGQVVYCHFTTNFSNRSGSASGVFKLDGLPFAISANNWNEDGGQIHYFTGITTPGDNVSVMCENTNKIQFRKDGNDNWTTNEVGTGAIRIRGSLVYHTAA